MKGNMPRLLVSLTLLFGCAGPRGVATPQAASNAAEAPIAHFDARLLSFMRRWNLPGGAVAASRGDQLLLERSYGLASDSEPVNERTRFRIASLSKSITSVTVHLLLEGGRLDLDEPVLPHLGVNESPVDPRWQRITIRHLLEHSAGFDRHISRDWMFESNYIAKELGRPGPPELSDIVELVFRYPLDFDPGSRFSYSNFGYALLGRVIESVTGSSYETAVRELVLSPCGVRRMELGQTRPELRPADESHYYADDSEAVLPSVFPGEGDVDGPDGGFYLRPMAAHGGWIATPRDLTAFMLCVDGIATTPDLLERESLDALLSRPHYTEQSTPDSSYYARGFFVIQTPQGRAWLHDGSKPGTTALMMRTEGATVVAALFNSRPTHGDISEDLERTLRQALEAFTPPEL